MKKSKIACYLSLAIVGGCMAKPVQEKSTSYDSSADSYIWLEEVEGTRALQFAQSESGKTLDRMKSDPRFLPLESKAREVILAKDRLPAVELVGGMLYNFWQDSVHVRGLFRRTTIESFQTQEPQWETVLDLDALALAEKENWVWQGSSELPPKFQRTLIHLSRGGKDASVVREFDLSTKEFVAGGFVVPEAKNSVSWKDENTIFVGTDYGPGSMTDSGYARIIKEWKRGTLLSEATPVFEAQNGDMLAHAMTFYDQEQKYIVYARRVDFYSGEFVYRDLNGQSIKLPMPADAELSGVFRENFLFHLRSDFGSFVKGSLVALPISKLQVGSKSELQNSLELVFAPTLKTHLQWVSTTKNHLLMTVLDNVTSKLVKVSFQGSGQWLLQNIRLGGEGVTSLASVEFGSDRYLAYYEDFLTPRTMYLLSASDVKKQAIKLKHAPSRFDSRHLKISRFEAASADGTKIPYFLVGREDLKLDGKNPTLLYGYGGFEVTLEPTYRGLMGRLWLERGGVYVLANLRGGGEFGPNWHQAVLKENRYKVYEDFVAIAEDLIKRKITSPQHLGIQGGSNGGLLTGATAMKRPDLFNAVLCEVPLLDMLRYHKLLAGASWMAEYGDPEDPKMREHILRYSPYQKISASEKYPEIFFMTNTKDDRVHPGHARKMFAKMKDLGHPVLYYENTEGGHAGNANLEQSILWSALEYTYLWMKLGSK